MRCDDYVLLFCTQVMGRSSPNDKLLLVQALRKRGHVVAVTGDGTNDAPALHEVKLMWRSMTYVCRSHFHPDAKITLRVLSLVKKFAKFGRI